MIFPSPLNNLIIFPNRLAKLPGDNELYTPPDQKTEPSTNSEQSAEDAYESLIMHLEKDISSQPDGKVPANLNLLDKTFRGATSELVNIIPGSERTLGLLLHSDDELDPKSLLKMQVEVGNNEEFKYYNNCYNIEPQVGILTLHVFFTWLKKNGLEP